MLRSSKSADTGGAHFQDARQARPPRSLDRNSGVRRARAARCNAGNVAGCDLHTRPYGM
jgi:hypothetical protein